MNPGLLGPELTTKPAGPTKNVGNLSLLELHPGRRYIGCLTESLGAASLPQKNSFQVFISFIQFA